MQRTTISILTAPSRSQSLRVAPPHPPPRGPALEPGPRHRARRADEQRADAWQLAVRSANDAGSEPGSSEEGMGLTNKTQLVASRRGRWRGA